MVGQEAQVKPHFVTRSQSTAVADHHLDIIQWHLIFTFGDTTMNVNTYTVHRLTQRIISLSPHNHLQTCSQTPQHRIWCETVHLERLMTMGDFGTMGPQGCLRIIYKSIETGKRSLSIFTGRRFKVPYRYHHHHYQSWKIVDCSDKQKLGCFWPQLYVIASKTGPISWYLRC